MFNKYNIELREIVNKHDNAVDWKKVHFYHRLMLKRIQHERIIHLIVTVFVGMCLMIVFLAAIITTNIYLGILSLILLLLFTAYIFHYRHLENMTQSWYILEDKIIKNEES